MMLDQEGGSSFDCIRGGVRTFPSQFGYARRFAAVEGFLGRIFGSCETLLSFDTYQFDDYSKFVAPRFDPAKKLQRRQEVFPEDCRKAFELGGRLAAQG